MGTHVRTLARSSPRAWAEPDRTAKEQSGADTEWGRGVGWYYGVQITVVEDDGRPARFTWEGRVYGVRRIIDHWITLRMDWVPAREKRVPERKHWRVEAGAAGPPGV